MEKKKKDGLHVNRYKTLKEHRAAVTARKALKGGKNKGPVANAAAYGETIKKPAAKKAATKAAPKKSTPKKPAATSSRPNQTVNGASLGSKLTPAERKKRLAEMAKTGSTTQGKSMPSNPKLKSQPKSTKKGASSSRKTGSNFTKNKVKAPKPKRSRRQNRRSRGY
jgi:hypothetical protein